MHPSISPASPQQGMARGLARAAGPPYPRKPAGCAPSPRSAAGGDARWCAGSSTQLRREEPGAVRRGPSPGPLLTQHSLPGALRTHVLQGSVPHSWPSSMGQSNLNQRCSSPRDSAGSQPHTNSMRPLRRCGARQSSTGHSRAGLGRGLQAPGELHHSLHGARHSRSCQPPLLQHMGVPCLALSPSCCLSPATHVSLVVLLPL